MAREGIQGRRDRAWAIVLLGTSAACVDLGRPTTQVARHDVDASIDAAAGAAPDPDGGNLVDAAGATADTAPANPCPMGFVPIPGSPEFGQFPAAFCVAKYEMKIAGDDGGDKPFAPGLIPESRPGGLPWTELFPSDAHAACGRLGDSFGLLTNAQWQTIARNIEGVPENWSGGAVGVGIVNQGHADAVPPRVLAAGPDEEPCTGTGETACRNPAHPSFSQKRTHRLSNGHLIWDLAGNSEEKVRDLITGPIGLWMRFDAAQLVQGPRAAEWRAHFAPAGPYTSDHGMGNLYGGDAEICRGGAFSHYDVGTASSEGQKDTGIFTANLICSGKGGFRCTFVP